MLDCQLDNARHDADTAKPPTTTTTATPDTKPKRERVKLMGIRQHLEVQRVRQQEKQEPDNWFVRKVRAPFSSPCLTPDPNLTCCVQHRSSSSASSWECLATATTSMSSGSASP